MTRQSLINAGVAQEGDIIAAVDARKENEMTENMRVWDAVSKTDPAHTKKVNQRGGFTAISAHYQIMRATEVFGPIGIGWGYVNGEPIFHDGLVTIPVTIWHGERSNTFGPLYGSAEVFAFKKLDSDAPKKASTDGLTKGLSQLGFNADVFLGRFDDNKYVEQMTKEFSPPADEPKAQGNKPKPLTGPYKTRADLKDAIVRLKGEMEACETEVDLDTFLSLDSSRALCNQVETEHEFWWAGDGKDFHGLAKDIQSMRELKRMADNEPWAQTNAA